MGRGVFIVIEGTSALAEKQLAFYLKEMIRTYTGLIVLTRGGNWEHADSHPQILLNYLAGWEQLPDEVVHHLFSAGRWEKMPEIMFQLSKQRRVVIQHRYVASGRAQTMAGGKLTQDWCRQFDTGLLRPDLTIYVERGPPPEHDEEHDSFWGPTHFAGPGHSPYPEVTQKVTDQFNEIKKDEPNWVTIDMAKLSPVQAMDLLRPIVIEKIIECVDDNKDFLFY